MAARTPRLTDEEQQTIAAALPSIRRAAPDAARIIDRLLRASSTDEATTRSRYASIAEVATAFNVTQQTIRNWADRGWLPCDRSPGGTRRIPRGVLASAHALARPRPASPDLSPEQIEAIVRAPRRAR